MEKKLKAYVDKVEAKYEDFSVMDAFSSYKKEMMEALDGDRSRSNSPKGDRQRGAEKKARDHEDSSDDGAAVPKFRSYSHNVDAAK